MIIGGKKGLNIDIDVLYYNLYSHTLIKYVQTDNMLKG